MANNDNTVNSNLNNNNNNNLNEYPQRPNNNQQSN